MKQMKSSQILLPTKKVPLSFSYVIPIVVICPVSTVLCQELMGFPPLLATPARRGWEP
jgi:hypothetical protein